jgi:hypothetical protein
MTRYRPYNTTLWRWRASWLRAFLLTLLEKPLFWFAVWVIAMGVWLS